MAALDLDLVRHALHVAQDHGFAEVELGLEGSSFKARLEAAPKKKQTRPSTKEPVSKNGEAEFKFIKSPIVGYYRLGAKPLEAGAKVKKGDVVAVINALGIANDVEASVGGEVVEVLVEDGQAVQFGQPLAKVKP